jgi:Arc/MetJ-type ribon-helix-helix transcriptional regulator
MTQIVARITDELAALVDELVVEGVVASRSEAIRRGLEQLIDQHRRKRTADAIVRGYRGHPQTEDEVGWIDAATVAMISEEQW